MARRSGTSCECRIEPNIDRILQLFADRNITGTFFTLGWIAKRYPQMVRPIVANGHELASHGMAHFRADQQSRRGCSPPIYAALKEAAGRYWRIASARVSGGVILGYAPQSWALNALEEAGYSYSSSTFPIRHDLYGMPEQPRFAFCPLRESRFMEIPVTTVAALRAKTGRPAAADISGCCLTRCSSTICAPSSGATTSSPAVPLPPVGD